MKLLSISEHYNYVVVYRTIARFVNLYHRVHHFFLNK